MQLYMLGILLAILFTTCTGDDETPKPVTISTVAPTLNTDSTLENNGVTINSSLTDDSEIDDKNGTDAENRTNDTPKPDDAAPQDAQEPTNMPVMDPTTKTSTSTIDPTAYDITGVPTDISGLPEFDNTTDEGATTDPDFLPSTHDADAKSTDNPSIELSTSIPSTAMMNPSTSTPTPIPITTSTTTTPAPVDISTVENKVPSDQHGPSKSLILGICIPLMLVLIAIGTFCVYRRIQKRQKATGTGYLTLGEEGHSFGNRENPTYDIEL